MLERNRIGPVAYGLAFYFLLSVLDTLNIAAVGSFLKILALVPLGMMLFQMRDLRLKLHSLFTLLIAFWLLAMVSLFHTISFDKTFAVDTTLTLNIVLILALGVMVPYNREELDLLQKAMLWGCSPAPEARWWPLRWCSSSRSACISEIPDTRCGKFSRWRLC